MSSPIALADRAPRSEKRTPHGARWSVDRIHDADTDSRCIAKQNAELQLEWELDERSCTDRPTQRDFRAVSVTVSPSSSVIVEFT